MNNKPCHCQQEFHDSAFPSMCCSAAKKRGDICPKCSTEVVYYPIGNEFSKTIRKKFKVKVYVDEFIIEAKSEEDAYEGAMEEIKFLADRGDRKIAIDLYAVQDGNV